MMRFLIDENLGMSFATILQSLGYVAVHVSQIGLNATDDAIILDYAEKQGYVVVTFDLDFSRLIATGNNNRCRKRQVAPASNIYAPKKASKWSGVTTSSPAGWYFSVKILGKATFRLGFHLNSQANSCPSLSSR